MNSEISRLQTFCNWPTSAPVDPPRIAKAGFYYTGMGLEVQCFSCAGRISHWNYGDQVMSKHRELKPNCAFVLNPTDSGNIPILDVFECSDTNYSSHWSLEDQQNDEDNGPQDYGLTEEDEMYRSDALRLLSFCNWDDSAGSRQALVNAGFYHAGEGRLRCAWCGGELSPYRSFADLRNPVEIHRMYFPRCDHAATVEAAQRSNSSNLSPPSSPPSDTPPIRSPETNQNQTLSTGAVHNARILNAGNTWRALGVVGSGARHPNMASLSTRLETFDHWPSDRTQSPKAMAEAGFFHTGIDDQVRCFYCDGGLGRWEAGDAPWSEHARWFSTCGYVLLVKGQEFVDECSEKTTHQTSVQSSAPINGVNVIRRNRGANFPATAVQINDAMESPIVLGALGAGLDAARVRRAVVRKMRLTGGLFTSSEALIDAVLDDQLNEEAWSVSSQSQRFARDILAETLRELSPRSGFTRPQAEDTPDSQTSESDRTRTPSPVPVPTNRGPPINLNQRQPTSTNQPINQNQPTVQNQPTARVQPTAQNQPTSQNQPVAQNQPSSQSQPKQHTPKVNEQSKGRQKRSSESENRDSSAPENRSMSLEEENRQLKEARLCKVCMDNEVSVVFLPCGHLVSCAGCGAALAACPLCRSDVRALVRAYLA